MSYEAAIFDFDDTLVKTREIKWAQHKAVALYYYGITLDDEKLLEHWGEPYDDTLRAYYSNADTIENMRAAKESFEAEFPLVAYEGALKLINKLLEASIKVGVLTASDGRLVRSDLQRLGFPVEKFFKIQSSENTPGIYKPNPAVFTPMLRYLAASGINNTVYIGNDVRDWEAAHQARLDFIGITSSLTSKVDFRRAGATQIIPTIYRAVEYFDI